MHWNEFLVVVWSRINQPSGGGSGGGGGGTTWMELTVKCTYVYSNFARVFIDDRLGFFFSILKEEEETRVATCNFDLIKIKHFDYKAPKSDEAHEEPILINCNKPPTINIQHVEIEDGRRRKGLPLFNY